MVIRHRENGTSSGGVGRGFAKSRILGEGVVVTDGSGWKQDSKNPIGRRKINGLNSPESVEVGEAAQGGSENIMEVPYDKEAGLLAGYSDTEGVCVFSSDDLSLLGTQNVYDGEETGGVSMAFYRDLVIGTIRSPTSSEISRFAVNVSNPTNPFTEWESSLDFFNETDVFCFQGTIVDGFLYTPAQTDGSPANAFIIETDLLTGDFNLNFYDNGSDALRGHYESKPIYIEETGMVVLTTLGDYMLFVSTDNIDNTNEIVIPDGGVRDLTYDEDSGLLYGANQGTDGQVIYDPLNYEIVGRLDDDGDVPRNTLGKGLIIGDRIFYLADDLYLFNKIDGSYLGTAGLDDSFSSSRRFNKLIYSEDENKIYTNPSTDNEILSIDPVSLDVERRINMPSGINGNTSGGSGQVFYQDNSSPRMVKLQN